MKSSKSSHHPQHPAHLPPGTVVFMRGDHRRERAVVVAWKFDLMHRWCVVALRFDNPTLNDNETGDRLLYAPTFVSALVGQERRD